MTEHKSDCAVHELSYGTNPCTCNAEKSLPRSGHKMGCASFYAAYGQELPYACDCSVDNPTPPAPTAKSCATCGWPKDHLVVNHDRCMACGGKEAGFRRWKSAQPTADGVRKAREYLYARISTTEKVMLPRRHYRHVRAILSALDQAQYDACEALAAAHASDASFKDQSAQLQAEELANDAQAKEIETLRELNERKRLLMHNSDVLANAQANLIEKQAEQIKRLREALGMLMSWAGSGHNPSGTDFVEFDNGLDALKEASK